MLNNQGLIEEVDHDHDDQGRMMMMMMMMMSSQMGFSLNPNNLTSTSSSSSFALDNHATTSSMPHQLLSLQTSSPTPIPWAWGGAKESQGMNKRSGEDHQRVGGVSAAMKMKKKMKGRRKVREPRFCFKTMSDVDVLDDGYKWRKYGQKVVKNTLHPRSYYRCTQDNCRVKKRVERLAEDPRMVITTYEGRHAHSPSHDLQHSQAPHPLLNNFFC